MGKAEVKPKRNTYPERVWVFVSTDSHESDAKWIGCVSLCRRKADALRKMRTQIRDDIECGLFTRKELHWSEDRMACYDNDGRMSYKVEQGEIE